MKAIITILLFLIITCSPQKDIQVEINKWTLIKKEPAPQHYFDDKDYVFMYWQASTGVVYSLRVSQTIADKYRIGYVIWNMDRR